MGKIAVAGGGMCGMAAAMMLADDGHDVTVFERDAEPPPPEPEAAFSEWNRRSVAQFGLAHWLQPRGTAILRDEVPTAYQHVADNGGFAFNFLEYIAGLSPMVEFEPGDERFGVMTGRRSTLEWAMATAGAEHSGVTVRRGAAIAGLIADTSGGGPPHVTGLRLADGSEFAADLVIDATGRRSPTPDWLADIGAVAPDEQAEDSGFAYYGRYFRGEMPAFLGGLLAPYGSFSILTLPADNDTWAVTLYGLADDKPLRRFRDPEVFQRVVEACPLHAHWLAGEPITDLTSMAGVVDRYRSFVVDGAPVATGMLSIADAASCTNPSLGRGITIGLIHAEVMRECVREFTDPTELALAFHERSQGEVATWHHDTAAVDRRRVREMRLYRDSEQPQPSDDERFADAMQALMGTDPVVTRGTLETLSCLTPVGEVLARPGFSERVEAAMGDLEIAAPPGPDREQLLELVVMTIALVHGNPEVAAIWDDLVVELGALGHDDIVTLSPPGFGVPLPDGFAATSDAYAEWLVGELEQLDGPVDLIGHDWGAGHALRAATARPDLVRRLVTDIAGTADAQYEWHDMAQVWQTEGDGEAFVEATAAMAVDERAQMLEAAGMTPAGARACAEADAAAMGTCILALYRSAKQPRMHMWGQQFAELDERPPVLVVIAENDHYTGGPEMAHRVAETWGAHVAELSGVGHWWMMEDPAQGAAALHEFLDS